MNEIVITVILKGKGIKKGRINPSVSFDKAKSDILKSYGISNPEDYDVFVSPSNKRQSLQSYKPSDGDVFYITEIGNWEGSSFTPVD